MTSKKISEAGVAIVFFTSEFAIYTALQNYSKVLIVIVMLLHILLTVTSILLFYYSHIIVEKNRDDYYNLRANQSERKDDTQPIRREG